MKPIASSIQSPENKNANDLDITSSDTKDITYLDTESKYMRGRATYRSNKVWENIGQLVEEDTVEHEMLMDKYSYRKILNSPSFDAVLIKELSKNFQSLIDNFEDLRLRQIYFSKIKENLSDLWSMKEEEGYYSELLLLINQAIEDIPSEDLDDKKVEAFEDAISRLERGGIKEEDIETLTTEFIESGISLVSPIPELSSLYSD